jgi:hypothetical protein
MKYEYVTWKRHLFSHFNKYKSGVEECIISQHILNTKIQKILIAFIFLWFAWNSWRLVSR